MICEDEIVEELNYKEFLPITYAKFGEVEGLPEPEEGTI